MPPQTAETERPSLWRLALGFAAAPVVAGGLLTALVIAQSDGSIPLSEVPPERIAGGAAIIIAYAAVLTVILALPAYWLLRKRLRLTAAGCALAGGIIFAAPTVALFPGRYLLADGAEGLFQATLPGVVAGLVFWLIAMARGRR